MLETLRLETFEPCRDQTFELHWAGGEPLGLVLAEIKALAKPGEGWERQPFSLTFRHPGERRHLPQGTFKLRHEQLGELEMFLVPLGPDAGGMRYEAVFT